MNTHHLQVDIPIWNASIPIIPADILSFLLADLADRQEGNHNLSVFLK